LPPEMVSYSAAGLSSSPSRRFLRALDLSLPGSRIVVRSRFPVKSAFRFP